jgi:hypothetical protein
MKPFTETATNLVAVRTATGTGEDRDVLSPSSPYVFAPQQYALPFQDTAQV